MGQVEAVDQAAETADVGVQTGRGRDRTSQICIYTFDGAGKKCHDLPVDQWAGYPYQLQWSPESTMVAFTENPVEFANDADIPGNAPFNDVLGAAHYSFAFNFLGLPAGIIPADLNDGLPVGVQVVGRRWREDLVLDALEAIEASTGLDENTHLRVQLLLGDAMSRAGRYADAVAVFQGVIQSF